MKESQLRQIVREEIQKFNESILDEGFERHLMTSLDDAGVGPSTWQWTNGKLIVYDKKSAEKIVKWVNSPSAQKEFFTTAVVRRNAGGHRDYYVHFSGVTQHDQWEK